jgi:hypothetical protein
LDTCLEARLKESSHKEKNKLAYFYLKKIVTYCTVLNEIINQRNAITNNYLHLERAIMNEYLIHILN